MPKLIKRRKIVKKLVKKFDNSPIFYIVAMGIISFLLGFIIDILFF